MSAVQECRQCGRCCEKWGWDQKGCADDIREWLASGREDILKHVRVRFADGRRCSGTDVDERSIPAIRRIYFWTDEEGRVLRHCPFFTRREDGRVYCGIHGAKPRVCRSFTPWNEGIRDYALDCPACRNTAP